LIELSIAHAPGGGVRVGTDPEALPATTEVLPERRLGRYSLVRCVTRTGRMHQVRVHLAAIGHPCVGDSRYGAPPTDLVTDGAFLHAERLELVHPVTERTLVLIVNLPTVRSALVASLT
jgi:23S rRNA pseudouridine1911/1915/1917 synthase